MKTIYLMIAGMLFSLFLGCSNSDDDAMTNDPTSQDPDTEIPSEPSPLEGSLFLGQFEQSLTIDGATGESIDSTPVELQNSFLYEGDFVSITENRLIRSSNPDLTGLIWEIDFSEFMGSVGTLHSDFTVTNSQIVIIIKYTNPTDFSSAYALAGIDLNDGSLLWQGFQDEQFYFVKDLGDRLITLEGRPGFQGETKLRTRNKETGALITEVPLGERVAAMTTRDDLAIIQSWSDRVFAVDQELNEVWNFETQGSNVHNGFFDTENLIFPSRDNTIYALDFRTGTMQWTLDLQESGEPILFDLDNDSFTLFNRSESNLIIKRIEKASGRELNEISIPRSTDGSDIGIWSFDNFLLISESNDTEYALSLYDIPFQEIRWNITTERRVNHGQGLINDEKIIFKNSLL